MSAVRTVNKSMRSYNDAANIAKRVLGPTAQLTGFINKNPKIFEMKGADSMKSNNISKMVASATKTLNTGSIAGKFNNIAVLRNSFFISSFRYF